jgi:cytoskeletal protein RodZ
LLKILPAAHQQLNDFQENLADVPLSASQATRKINLVWLFASLGLAGLLGLGVWLAEEKPIEKKLIESEIAIIPIAPAVSAVAVASAVTTAMPIPASTPTVAAVKPAPVTAAPVVVPQTVVPAQIVKALVAVVLPVVIPASKLPAIAAQSAVAAVKPNVTSPKKDEKATQASSELGKIRMLFNVDSWVFITDKFGKTIHKQTNAAGTELNLNGRPPYNVTIANAKNVRLFYEGEEVDLKDFTDVSVARLILE